MEELYSFVPEDRTGRNDEEDAKAYFKAFFGDEYNEENVSKRDEANYFYLETKGVEEYNSASYINGCPLNAQKKGSFMLGSNDYELKQRYYPDTDGDVMLAFTKYPTREASDGLPFSPDFQSSFLAADFYTAQRLSKNCF